MTYDDIITLRSAIIDDIKEEFFDLPLTVEHHKLCEMRLQTIILLFNKNSTSKEIKDVIDDVKNTVDSKKKDRIKKYG